MQQTWAFILYTLLLRKLPLHFLLGQEVITNQVSVVICKKGKFFGVDPVCVFNAVC